MMTRVCDLLGIQYPIFQGAMARIAEHTLAAAVSNAGGLGIIAAGNTPVDILREEIRAAKAATSLPFGVNIMLMSPTAADVAQLVLDENVRVVTTGAGSPGVYMDVFKKAGICVIPVVPSVAIAKRMEKLGADAVIAEGMEAGGHIGKLTTFSLLPQVTDAVQIPVLGAGGIADGRGMAAAFMLGASGVQVGTRFLTARECIVHQNYKDMVLRAKDIDTAVTGQLTGHPVRVLRNKLSRLYDEVEREEMRKEQPDLARIDQLGIGKLRAAVVDGDVENGSVMAGQIAGMVCKEQTCREIIDEMMGEFHNLVK